MTTRTLTRWGTAGALGLLMFAGASPAHAAETTAIDKGGAFCLRMGTVVPGATSTVFSLDIDPADHPTKQRMWWVSGVERATNPDVATDNYVNLVNGTATLAKPNNGQSGGKLIHLALTGTSFGSDTDVSVTGIWVQTYNLQLNPKTLKGTITGMSVFTPISGTTAGPATTVAVSERIAPMNCKNL